MRIFNMFVTYLQSRATENRYFASSDRFLVCNPDSICIKHTFFGPKKRTLRIIYWPNYLDKSSVKWLIAHNYSNYQCCQHIIELLNRGKWDLVSSRYLSWEFAEFPVLELIKYSWHNNCKNHMRTWLAFVSQPGSETSPILLKFLWFSAQISGFSADFHRKSLDIVKQHPNNSAIWADIGF